MPYYAGDRIRIKTIFRSIADALVDPTTVAITTTLGALSPVTKTYSADVEVVKESLGTFYMDYTPASAGVLTIRVRGTGTAPITAVSVLDILAAP